MPCFKGLAVSIHTADGALPEYSIQKQTRHARITSYIPVPNPKITPGSTKPEQSTFAISITLLTSGLGVPYSRPQPTAEDPFPVQKIVGSLRGNSPQHGSYIGPYIPLTTSPNETIAAYIHFDGRAKEEVATLLRRGEETWVNSRWVSVPDSEGGGLAEREFLFREVGLERWLNGLDLEGESKDIAARVERRKRKLEKRRLKRQEHKGSDDEEGISKSDKSADARNHVLRYGEDKQSPVETLSAEEGMFSSDSDSEDDVPIPEATGQIKVSLFRVLASGEIKRGEYSPQFDAHDDEDVTHDNSGESNSADVDHTTTFAKPKTLDPKSISTQTVTGIDPADRPYATFTFLYRGKKQLQKMGILTAPEASEKRPATAKRKSEIDFSSLTPLKPKGGTGFAGYRDSAASPPARKANGYKPKDDDDDMDSDHDDGDDVADERINGDIKGSIEYQEDESKLSVDEISRRAELADGVKKIQLKRQHSFEPPSDLTANRKPSFSPSTAAVHSSFSAAEPASPQGPVNVTGPSTASGSAASPKPSASLELSDLIGSPFKKQRASVSGKPGEYPTNILDDSSKFSSNPTLGGVGGIGINGANAPSDKVDAKGSTTTADNVKPPVNVNDSNTNMDDEL